MKVYSVLFGSPVPVMENKLCLTEPTSLSPWDKNQVNSIYCPFTLIYIQAKTHSSLDQDTGNTKSMNIEIGK